MASTINHRRDGKGKREADRCAESMRRSVIHAWLFTSTKMKEEGRHAGYSYRVGILRRYKLLRACVGQVSWQQMFACRPKSQIRKCEPQIQSVSADGYRPNCFGGLQ